MLPKASNILVWILLSLCSCDHASPAFIFFFVIHESVIQLTSVRWITNSWMTLLTATIFSFHPAPKHTHSHTKVVNTLMMCDRWEYICLLNSYRIMQDYIFVRLCVALHPRRHKRAKWIIIEIGVIRFIPCIWRTTIFVDSTPLAYSFHLKINLDQYNNAFFLLYFQILHVPCRHHGYSSTGKSPFSVVHSSIMLEPVHRREFLEDSADDKVNRSWDTCGTKACHITI